MNSTNETKTKKELPVRSLSAGTREDNTIEINLVDLLQYYLTKWHFLLIGFVIGAVIAGLYTYFLVAPTFSATSKLYMVSNSSDTIVDLSDFNIGNSLSSDYEQLLKVRPIMDQIIEEEKLDYTCEQLRSMINIATISNTRILTITVVSTSPNEAMTIANALADKAVEEIPVLMDTATPNIAERAIVPDHKSGPSMKKNVVLGALLGIILVGGILTLIYLMDDTMATAEDVEKKLGIMPLTIIPEGDLSEIMDEPVYGSHTKHKNRKNRKGGDQR